MRKLLTLALVAILVPADGGASADLLPSGRCEVACPPGAMIEGEPGCYDGYQDDYDGGCAGSGWLPLFGDDQGCATVCGTGCSYVLDGLSYRDMDFYEVTAMGGPVTFSCLAEFPVTILLWWSTNCPGEGYQITTATPCVSAELSWSALAGQAMWLTVTPTEFSGIPEAASVFTVCGLQPAATPAEALSWGKIKDTYRGGAR